LELESNEGKSNDDLEEDSSGPLQGTPDSWDRLFREQMQYIIQLWDLCHVSIIHRTQFYLLFRGDRADQIYIEVEVRRLTWLQQHFAEVGDASPAAGDDTAVSLESRLADYGVVSSMLFLSEFYLPIMAIGSSRKKKLVLKFT
jgi:centromeric protein E